MRNLLMSFFTISPFVCERKAVQALDEDVKIGSGFYIKTVSPQQTRNLFKLGKIWGFLKYHHPEIAKGKIDWDKELFRALPIVLSGDFDSNIQAWISDLGSMPPETKAFQPSGDVKIFPNTDWIHDSTLLGKGLRGILEGIKQAPPAHGHHYIAFFSPARNPIFTNEKAYPDMAFTDTGYCLLGLFRFWNMIEYFFPYKHLIDKKWDDVFIEQIPKFVAAKDELSYKLTLLELIGEVQDTHAKIRQDPALEEFHGKRFVPVELSFIEEKPVVVGIPDIFSENSELRVGDVILSIDGTEAESLIEQKIKYCPASNYPAQLRDAARRLLRTDKDYLSLTIENAEGMTAKKAKTEPFFELNIFQRPVPSHQHLEDAIGYIYPGALKSRSEIASIMKSFLKKKGIIIDLRCYPSQFIVYDLGKYLMPEPTEFFRVSEGEIENPGLFRFGASGKVGKKNKKFYRGKVAVLINELTLSQAEFTTMALRVAPNVTVIGSTTAGADGNISFITLPGNVHTSISGIGIYYPDGTETQRVGIIPDLFLKPTIEGIRGGRDELLEKAIEIINTGK
jgi:hypothetical protein